MPAPIALSTNLALRTIDPLRCAALIDTCGTDAFAELLLELASEIAAVEEIFIWERQAGFPPHVLAAASWLDDQRQRVEGYAGRFFRSDPLVEQAGPMGLFLHVIAAKEISFLEYRQICFERPLFDHKISFVLRQPDHTLVLNFYLKEGASDPDPVITSLTFLANVAIASLLRQQRASEPGMAVTRLEGRLKARFPELSRMECAVLARFALAMPPREIAKSLAIKTTSVKTYKSRALTKLGHGDAASALAQVIG